VKDIESQLGPEEKTIVAQAVAQFAAPIILEIGTYKGGGSTLTFLEALQKTVGGKLYGVEADASVFSEMKNNIRSVNPDYFEHFTPIRGFSQQVIPELLKEVRSFDIAFLDGGNNPREQIEEFTLLHDAIPVGGYLFAHDANLRKGRWLVPYILELDNWRVVVHQVSEEGLLEAKKITVHPSADSLSRADRILRRNKRSLIEVATLFFPSSFKGVFLKLLPFKLRRLIGEGRKEQRTV